MLQLKCPNCGADITLDDTREFGFALIVEPKFYWTNIKNE